MRRVAPFPFALVLFVNVTTGAMAQQFPDPAFDPTVDRPAFTDRHPVVLLDEAHHNFHTAGGRYRPFADLVRNDGYDVRPNTKKFSAEALQGCNKSYAFRKGEDVTAIGNPGAGGELILENAISRGLMSTKTALEGQRYYQLGIAVNPGNSGGPVFNSRGAVIGVVTRKSTEQESLAFCIPVEDLNLAIEKVATYPQDAIDREESRHRLILAVKELGSSGALYATAIGLRRPNVAATAKAKATHAVGNLDTAVSHLERQTMPTGITQARPITGSALSIKT